MIFVPTVQHTGTWFILRFIEKFGYEIKQARFIIRDHEPVKKNTVIQAHFPMTESGTVYDYSHPHYNIIKLLTNLMPTVIPLRDPLRAIITREARQPNLRHYYIVDGFVTLAKEYSEHPNVLFAPIDLKTDYIARHALLTNIARHCGFDTESPIIEEVAREWPKENPTPDNRFEEIYNKKDWEQLKYLFGPKVAELEYLKSRQHPIKPFLDQHGYFDLWP